MWINLCCCQKMICCVTHLNVVDACRLDICRWSLGSYRPINTDDFPRVCKKLPFEKSINQFYFARCGKMRGSTKRLRGLAKWPRGQHVSQPLKRTRKAITRVCLSQRNKRKNTHKKTQDIQQIKCRKKASQTKKTSQTSSGTSNESLETKTGLLASNEASAYIMPGIN